MAGMPELQIEWTFEGTTEDGGADAAVERVVIRTQGTAMVFDEGKAWRQFVAAVRASDEIMGAHSWGRTSE